MVLNAFLWGFSIVLSLCQYHDSHLLCSYEYLPLSTEHVAHVLKIRMQSQFQKVNHHFFTLSFCIDFYFDRAGITCYIPSEGLMPGQSFQDEIADKIKRGCRKTIIIMSPEYIDSPWCTYEARLAHHKNPG